MIDIYKTYKDILNQENIESERELINITRELLQKFILSGLSQTNFFKNNAFMGGTALRLFYDLDRYSEDLDFNMKNNDKTFSWKPYIDYLKTYGDKYELKFIFEDKSTDDNNTKKLFIHEHSLIKRACDEKIMNFNFEDIKKEDLPKVQLDTSFQVSNFQTEEKIMRFPFQHSIQVFTLPCLCSGKVNACLTRQEKDKITQKFFDVDHGRDWYDLIWYVKNGIISDNYYLSDKMNNKGKWRGKNTKVDNDWIKQQLLIRMLQLDYDKINREIISFTNKNTRITLDEKILRTVIKNFGFGGNPEEVNALFNKNK